MVAWVTARPPLKWTASTSRQMAVAILIFSIVMFGQGLAFPVLEGLAPAGDPGRTALRYMFLIAGAMGVAYSVYLFLPGVGPAPGGQARRSTDCG